MEQRKMKGCHRWFSILLTLSLVSLLQLPTASALFVFPERAHSSQVAPSESNDRGGRFYSSNAATTSHNTINSPDSNPLSNPLSKNNFGNSAILPQNDRLNNDYDNLQDQYVHQSTENGRYGTSSNQNSPENELEKLTNTYPIVGEQTEQFKSLSEYEASRRILEQTQGRFFDEPHKKKRRRRKKRPCIPHAYRPPKYGSRTYPVNLVFVEVNNGGGGGGTNNYKPTGGYYCRPRPMFGGGHFGNGQVFTGLYDYFFGDDYDDDDDDSVSNADEEEYDDGTYDEVLDNDNNPVNSHGSLLPSTGVAVNYPQAVSSTAYGGGYGGSVVNSNVGGATYNRVPSGAGAVSSGGPLGFFGSGGLFDISGGSNTPRPQVHDPYATRPVYESNVGDIVNNAITWRPNTPVGGIQNTVNGFVQQVASGPGRTINRINRQLYSTLVEPFTSLFY